MLTLNTDTRKHPWPARRAARRSGAILLVVLALLALFAVIGLSFVLYAESEANAARINRDTVATPVATPPDPNALVNTIFQQIVHGDPGNTGTAFRGHDLNTLLYGGSGGTTPYNGVGTISQPIDPTRVPLFQAAGLVAFDRKDAIHYAPWGNPYSTGTNDTVAQSRTMVVDPETAFPITTPVATGFGALRTGTPLPPQDAALPQTTLVTVPKNAPYTYPDRNNALLAMLDPRSGQVRVVSGVREVFAAPPPFTPNPNGTLALGNPNWYNVEGRFKTLRPRPYDHLTYDERRALGPLGNPLATLTPAQVSQLDNFARQGQLGQFPFPVINADGTVTGDVQNLPYSTANPGNDANGVPFANGSAVADGRQRMDAVWMFPNLQVFEYKGKRVTALIAPTLVPLDGRVNLNVGGNTLAAGSTHGSHSGFGPHEINLARVLENDESTRATVPAYNPGTAGHYARQIIQKRYGPTGLPPAPRELPSTGDASFLSTATNTASPQPGGLYPTLAPGVVVRGPKAFHPINVPGTPPADVNFASANKSALRINQLRPPLATTVNWGAESVAYQLPGLDPTPGLGQFRSGPQFRYQRDPATGSYDGGSTFRPTDPSATTAPGPQPPSGDTLDHPLTWNPYHRDEFAVGTGTNTFGLFPLGDLRSIGARYSDRKTRLTGETFLASPTSFLAGSAQFGGDLPTSVSHHARNRVTPISNSRPAGGLAANYFGDPRVKLKLLPGLPVPQLVDPSNAATNPRLDFARITDTTMMTGVAIAENAGATDTPSTANPNDPAGVPQNTNLANARARLGPIDLNRPLRDYRNDLNQRLSNTTVTGTTSQEALTDRQRLAYDIFIRLAVSTGASVRWNGSTFVLPTPSATTGYEFAAGAVPPATAPIAVTPEEYNALRWLAQYAANVVDAVDSDDVSTSFVWNPRAAANPQDPVNYSADPATETPMNGLAPLANRVVFGVEKPRLVLNEVYAEMANDESDATNNDAKAPFQARFFVEMLNPSNVENPPPPPPAPQPVLPRNVPLNYVPAAGPVYPVYRIQVFDNSAEVRQQLADPGRAEPNVVGSVVQSGSNLRRIEMPLTDLTGPAGVFDEKGQPVDAAREVEPNNGEYNGGGAQRRGFALVGPGSTAPGQPLKEDNTAYRPNVSAAPFNTMLQKTLAPPGPTFTDNNKSDERQMAYFLPAVKDDDTRSVGTTVGKALYDPNRKHAVVLQRLANPYLRGDDPASPWNQWVTVDVVYDVQLQDALRKAKKEGMDDGSRMMGYPKDRQERYSIGRVQPFAGAMPQDPNNPATNKTNSLTVRQQPNPAQTTDVQQTFMRHNGQTGTGPAAGSSGDTTLDFPFEWMVHLDRRAINAEELLHVATTKPHELTTQFARPNTAGGRSVMQLHSLRRWLDPASNPGLPPAEAAAESAAIAASPLYRALDLLVSKPWGHDMPLAGRVPGRINVNMIWDKKVFEALLDQNSGSSFTGPATLPTAPPVASQDIERMWTDFQQMRSPQFPAVGNTADEATGAPGTLDRPFKGFGAPRFGPGGNLVSDPTAGRGGDDTLLRTVTDGAGPGRRLLFARPQAGRTDTHPYRDNEALRKVLNNVTTTSDTFLLVFTVGYFEVRQGTQSPDNAADPIVLGKEVFDRVPGDLRAKFAAVIDRTHLAQTGPAPDPITGTANAPWLMELQSDLSTGTATPPDPSARILLPPQGVDQTTWPGNDPNTIPPSDLTRTELYYNVKRPPVGTNEYSITPRYGRFSNGQVIPVGTNGSYQEFVLTGKYEGRDFTISARHTPPVGSTPDSRVGTRFYIGTGRKQTLVEAYYNSFDPATLWSYNPITGQTKITLRVLAPAEDGPNQTYAPGTILSSVVFGSPTAPAVDVRSTSPTVPFFTRLTP